LNCFEKGQDIRRFSRILSMDNVKTLTPLIAAALLISSAIVFMSHIPQVEAADDWVVFNVKTADTNTPIRNAKIIINNTIAVYTNATGQYTVSGINRNAKTDSRGSISRFQSISARHRPRRLLRNFECKTLRRCVST
jgi:hypothetical protein